MRRLGFATCTLAVLAVIACSGADTRAADSSAAAAPAPAPNVTAADFAGTWTITTKNATGDSVLVTSELMATADTTGWMLHLPNRPPIPAKVITIGGDSVVTETAPYESVLMKGVQVWTRSVFHLENGMLRGTTIAHYSNLKTADSVRTLMTDGVRKP